MKMKQKLRSRLLAICTALICGCVMLLSGGVIDIESYAATDTGEVSVIFTHDMHSHMDADRVSKDGKVVEDGATVKADGTTPSFSYKWTKYNANGVATNWNGTSEPVNASTKPYVTVAADDVKGRGTFTCEVSK